MLSRTNRTDPSARANCRPPECLLRNEYNCGQSLYGSYRVPFVRLLWFGGMAVVPPAPLAYGHVQCALRDGMSSPIMNVLLVPSVMSVSFRLFRKSRR